MILQNNQPLSNLGQWALHYTQQGLAVFPLVPKTKIPRKGSGGFKDAVKDPEVINRWWTEVPDGNIAAATGAASGFVVIDVDGNTGVISFNELQSRLGQLPATVTVVTPGKIRDGAHTGLGYHFWFRLPVGVSINSQNGVVDNIDIKGEGGYVLVVPSVHPDGTGNYAFMQDKALHQIAIAELPSPWIEFLVDETKKKTSPANPVADPDKSVMQAPVNSGSIALDDNLLKRIVAYLDTCAPAVQGQNGHSALLMVANSLVHGFGLEPDTAARIAWQHYNPKCQPPWGDAEWSDFYRKFTEARDKPLDKPFCWLLNEAVSPMAGGLVLDPQRTKFSAEAFLAQYYTIDGVQSLYYLNGNFYAWHNNAYRLHSETRLRAEVLDFLDAASIEVNQKGGIVLKPYPARKPNVDNVVDALKGVALLDSDKSIPCWLGGDPAPVIDPSMIVFGKTRNLDLATMQAIESSPKWFNYSAIDIDYVESNDGSIPLCPTWDNFMFQLFGEDEESKRTLMMFIGLLLTPITKFQKALFIIGPKRSGKGTIARIIQKLVGERNFCGPATDGLAGHFGAQQLIGKTVAIVSDARITGQNQSTLTERILTITGEDTVTIDVKHRDPVTMRLSTRFVFLSNELPRLTDSAGALAGRFVVLKLTKSFYGQEDIELENKLIAELPGILVQAVAALQDLFKRGHFIQPESARDEVEQLKKLTSPIANFVGERCEVGEAAAGCWTSSDVLYAAWRQWCDEEGLQNVGSKSTFIRNLTAAVPGLVQKRSSELPNRPRGYLGITLKISIVGNFDQ